MTISFSSFSQLKTGVKWMTLSELEVAMTIEKKKVFIDLYTDWCGWCKRMDATTFTDPTVVDYISKNYYCVKFDAERRDTVTFNNYKFYDVSPTSKRGTNLFAYTLLEGKMSYPSFVMLDTSYNRINVISGYKTPEPLLGTFHSLARVSIVYNAVRSLIGGTELTFQSLLDRYVGICKNATEKRILFVIQVSS